MKVVIQERGQVTVPKKVRQRLALRKGTELEIEIVPGGFVARKRGQTSPLRALVGILGEPGSTDAVMNELRGKPDAIDDP
ncbi:MAG: AbrB/MazE/SpoVT family DNA-binding domain-containing protein [Myxococcota bacterium]